MWPRTRRSLVAHLRPWVLTVARPLWPERTEGRGLSWTPAGAREALSLQPPGLSGAVLCHPSGMRQEFEAFKPPL